MLDEPEILTGSVSVDRHGLLRDHRRLRRVDDDTRRLERLSDVLEPPGLRVDLERIGLRVHVDRAGIDRCERDVVRIGAVARDRDHAARLELPGDRASAGKLAAGLLEHGPALSGPAVAVVGRGLDEDRHAARAVALVRDLLVLLALTAA